MNGFGICRIAVFADNSWKMPVEGTLLAFCLTHQTGALKIGANRWQILIAAADCNDWLNFFYAQFLRTTLLKSDKEFFV
jgi:hypothetical protein